MKDSLISDVKFNCDVSDAKFWGYFSLCGLLMRFRDLYRSERNLPPWAPIDQKEISGWIAEKEARWAELEAMDFRTLMIEGEQYDPFDISGINNALKHTGLIYGAGYGVYMKPNFLLAELQARTEILDYTVYFAERELARDVFVSSGMVQGRCIFLRLEPLQAFLWEKFLESGAKKNLYLDYGFQHYGFSPGQNRDAGFEKDFKEMVRNYSDVVLHHELAEAMEDVPEWPDILTKAGDRDTELLIRALKDLISDTSGHGPLKKIILTKDRGALGLYTGLIDGYRKGMYPEIRQAFQKFVLHEEWQIMEAAREAGYSKFIALREKVLASYKAGRSKESLSREVKALLS